jgi:response regulator RpfG family c-di-GMP phosphodiesterase
MPAVSVPKVPLEGKWLLDKLRSVEHGRRQTVLIVDDDEISRYVMRDLLADTRFEIIEARNGTEAIRMAR